MAFTKSSNTGAFQITAYLLHRDINYTIDISKYIPVFLILGDPKKKQLWP